MNSTLKSFMISIILIGFQSCRSETYPESKAELSIVENVSERVELITTYRIYGVTKNGGTGDLAFVKIGNILYNPKSDGGIGRPGLVREGNIVYGAYADGSKGNMVFVIEKEKFAYEAMPDGSKGKLVLIMEGNEIYSATGNGEKGKLEYVVE